jgi:uncharacterized protein with HEPN domain
MKPRYWFRLHDMLTCIAGIREAIQGQTFESFVASWTLQRAVERGIEIISEASKHIPEEVKSRHPAVPWPEVRAIGNHLRHT